MLRHLWANQCAHQQSLICFYCSAYNFKPLNQGIPKTSGRCTGCCVFKYLRIWHKVSFMRCSSFIERALLVYPHLQQPVHCLKFLFLITPILKPGDLAAAYSTTSLTELKQNHSSGLVENDLSLFAEIPRYFYFV